MMVPIHVVDERPEYADAVSGFRMAELETMLQGSLEHGINGCIECCDRHAAAGGVALHYLRLDGRRESVSFATLQERAARFANVLAAQGIKAGDTVAAMLPRTPDLLVTILGTWRAGAVYQPLFTAFGPKAIEQRISTSQARLIVTDTANRAKFDEVSSATAIAVFASPSEPVRDGDVDVHAETARQDADFTPVLRSGVDLLLMMSTSGTSGPPKGVPVPISALLSFYVYMRDGVDLRPADVFWNIADPGWAYGLYYAVIGPLVMGHAIIFYNGPFTAETAYRIMAEQSVTSLAGSPTAFRLLMAAGHQAAAALKGQLRVVSSAGEPLNPEVIRWFAEHLAAPIHDHYGQTETGMVVNNHHRLRHAIHPGSAGFAMPGFRVAVLDDAGRELPPNESGELAVDIAASPLMWFDGYWRKPTGSIRGGYYRTGDTVHLEPDGRISFVGRADDVITSSGYRIGPFDVESALIEHPAVLESAVIGKPDPERTEIVKAFVVLNAGFEPSDALAETLRLHVRQRLSAHAYPREIEFMSDLPKTPSGKLQRFMLRGREATPAGRPFEA